MDAEFISGRDSFYQASVGENGWPYVQHRGGSAGFLKIIDKHTLGYADFRGNRQYISVGNINADERMCLFLMDYANRRRLKIWARAQVIHEDDNPEVYKQLSDFESGAMVERAVIIHIEALEWNCSKHITQRFTENEIKEILLPLMAENEQLKMRLARYENKE
jgi:predicted pyridoxine 5'-phosphate oxidase superfamily flavin-nucleotide-binding protein